MDLFPVVQNKKRQDITAVYAEVIPDEDQKAIGQFSEVEEETDHKTEKKTYRKAKRSKKQPA